MNVNLDIIRRAFDRPTFSRGESYAREGMVSDVRLRGDRLVGEVRGSGWNVYTQSIRILHGSDGTQFQGNCSCPMAYNCKHVVAVLLAGLERDLLGTSSAAGLSLPAALWLQQLAHVSTSATAPAAPARAAATTYRMAYVLCPDPRTGQPNLLLCKARHRGNGEIAGASVLGNIRELTYALPAYTVPEDELPLRIYATMCNRSAFDVSTRPSGKLGAQLLAMLGGDGRLRWAASRDDIKAARLAPVRQGPTRHAAVGWRANGSDADTVRLRWLFDDGTPVDHVFPTDPVYYLQDGLLGELVVPGSLAAMPVADLMELLEQAPVLDARERESMAESMLELGLDQIVPPPLVLPQVELDGIVPVPGLILGSMPVPGPRGRVDWHDYAVPGFTYDNVFVEAADTGPVTRRGAAGGIETLRRDGAAEDAALATLAGLGFTWPEAGTPLSTMGVALQLGTQDDWLRFAQEGAAQLRDAGWNILLNDDYRYDLQQVDDWYADVADDSQAGNRWFELELGIVVGGQRQPLLPLLVQLIRNAPHHFDPAALARHDDASQLLLTLPDGGRVALPWGRVKPILAILGELYFRDDLDATLRLPLIDAARLAELEQASQLRWLGGERLRQLGHRLNGFGGVAQVAPPLGLQASLRDYQREGLAWMQFLREYDFAGILADDMGLGKTVQTLAHILLEKEAGRLDVPALVVVPTSLVGNWCAEAARFAPGLRVLPLRGKERLGQFDRIGDADLVLTTYALLPRDEDVLCRHRFHLLILDESQYIKNSRAKAAQTVRLLKARHRLCLTGTPLQNHLGELWSQFNFLMPGLLGDEKTFNSRYRKPIEQEGDAARNAFLTRRVKPFMLRRTKDKVASELPPKTEMVWAVELGSAQRDLYETVRLAMDRKVRDEIERKGVARSQIVILDALLKMRQVCCDPRLVKRTGVSHGGVASAKLAALLELVETLLSEGRKILVFSQFTSMLDLISAELRSRAVDYVTLTGDTQDRVTPVASFQEGDVPVFLISLKAGGVGLNLTAADAVIHYDPWWNPASENQATDRAWRIGQDKPVFVYKLIAQGTLEEKIQEMQRRKGALANAVMGEGGALDVQLTQEDLQAIFAPL